MKSSYLVLIMFTLASCGGGGGGDNGPNIATGQFKDSNTIGLSYTSGSQSGVTTANGSFTYEVGKTVTFSIGNVVIGTSAGKSIVTPLDLVAGGSSSNTQVLNIVRFLMMLDDDGLPLNGINISSKIPAIAANWPQIDFTTADLATALTSIISDAASVDGGTHTLPDAITAKAHLEQTLLCIFSGAYKGSYSGDDYGNFGIKIDPKSGNINGFAYSIPQAGYLDLVSTSPIDYAQNASFTSGDVASSSLFSGQLSSAGTVSGTWVSNPYSGEFSATRIGGKIDAKYRFTGKFLGSDVGLITFDVDSADNVTGTFYSAISTKLMDLTGTVSGTTLSATVSDGTSITGDLNKATGVLSGTWEHVANVVSGTISGNGCQLN